MKGVPSITSCLMRGCSMSEAEEIEIRRVIGRLESSDPDFDDCSDAVTLIKALSAKLCRPLDDEEF